MPRPKSTDYFAATKERGERGSLDSAAQDRPVRFVGPVRPGIRKGVGLPGHSRLSVRCSVLYIKGKAPVRLSRMARSRAASPAPGPV